jgi:hypothetical protein
MFSIQPAWGATRVLLGISSEHVSIHTPGVGAILKYFCKARQFPCFNHTPSWGAHIGRIGIEVKCFNPHARVGARTT